MNLYDEILKRAKLNDKNIVCAYQYGSRVYGTFNSKSDYDFIVILNNKTTEQFSDNLININFYSVIEQQNRLNDHEISALECYFLSDIFKLKETKKFIFKLNLPKLRISLSAKASNSFVKSKKKLTVEKDYDLDIGRKSMFHSFRIINFGIQIATKGKIYDYSSCNSLYKEIINYYNWNELFDIYKEKYNNIRTEFKKLAPKN